MLSPCWLSTEQCGLPSSVKRKFFSYDVIPEMNFTVSWIIGKVVCTIVIDAFVIGFIAVVLLVLFVGGSTFCKALLPCWINSLNVLSVLLHCLLG